MSLLGAFKQKADWEEVGMSLTEKPVSFWNRFNLVSGKI
jgi:hypothetical protein